MRRRPGVPAHGLPCTSRRRARYRFRQVLPAKRDEDLFTGEVELLETKVSGNVPRHRLPVSSADRTGEYGSQITAARTSLPEADDGQFVKEDRLRRWWIIPLAVIVIDQVTKWIIEASLPYGSSIPVTGYFNLGHVRNTGAAFSFLADAGGWQRYFFIALAIVVSAVFVWMLRKSLPIGEAVGLSLIIGGALSNALDRMMRGHVVDMLDFHWRGWHWPAFNAADIAITSGAALLIAGSVFAGSSSRATHR